MSEPPAGVSEAPKPAAPNPSPPAYRVQLDAYAGPLDLLLYLVKRHEIDLNDIPMAELTEQYLNHLKVIDSLGDGSDPSSGGPMDVERAGEFLVMAATLVEIKSAMLMPHVRQEEDEDGVDPTQDAAVDPRFELVQQLLAYKRYKDASLALDERRAEWDHRFPAGARPGTKTAEPTPGDSEDEAAASSAPVELDLEDVNVMDLCSAFGRMLDAIGFTGDHEVTYDDTPISLHAEDIADRLERDGGPEGMTLATLFIGRKSRSEMIGLFLATLELVRQRRILAIQPPAGGDIRLQLRPEGDRTDLDDSDDQASRDWKNPETGEIEYDWPDEESRRRAEKRARIRAVHAAKDQSASEDADDNGDESGEQQP
ncbi:MAG: segregation/condensation protein A [Planctomycetota bacterium]